MEFISDLIACLLQGCYQRRDITWVTSLYGSSTLQGELINTVAGCFTAWEWWHGSDQQPPAIRPDASQSEREFGFSWVELEAFNCTEPLSKPLCSDAVQKGTFDALLWHSQWTFTSAVLLCTLFGQISDIKSSHMFSAYLYILHSIKLAALHTPRLHERSHLLYIRTAMIIFLEIKVLESLQLQDVGKWFDMLSWGFDTQRHFVSVH